MKKTFLLIIQTLVFVFSTRAHEEAGEDTALSFDKPIAATMEFYFEIEEDIYPEQSSFKIQDFAFLINERGERAALVNLTNTASALRSISTNHTYGLFADGSYRRPQNLGQRIDGGSTRSVLIKFGYSKSPLVKLIVRNF